MRAYSLSELEQSRNNIPKIPMVLSIVLFDKHTIIYNRIRCSFILLREILSIDEETHFDSYQSLRRNWIQYHTLDCLFYYYSRNAKRVCPLYNFGNVVKWLVNVSIFWWFIESWNAPVNIDLNKVLRKVEHLALHHMYYNLSQYTITLQLFVFDSAPASGKM